jgi:hypothetical protein
MERLSDYLVFCDMDNTLLTAKEGIPACNRSVIRLWALYRRIRPSAGVDPRGAGRYRAFAASNLLQWFAAV